MSKVARSSAGTDHHNTLVLQSETLRLELLDDVKLPDAATLVLEGLEVPVRLPVQDHYDAERGTYLFVFQGLVPETECRAAIETESGQFPLFENADLHAFVKQAIESDSEPPIAMHLPAEFAGHVQDSQDDSVDDPVPRDEDGDWALADDQLFAPDRDTQPMLVPVMDDAFDSAGDN